jgi:hypothetical protein
MVSPMLRCFLHKIGRKYGHACGRRRGGRRWRTQVAQSARTKENARTGKPVRAKFPFWKRVDKS